MKNNHSTFFIIVSSQEGYFIVSFETFYFFLHFLRFTFSRFLSSSSRFSLLSSFSGKVEIFLEERYFFYTVHNNIITISLAFIFSTLQSL